MAWSPQARRAAALARKRKHHGSARRHIGAKYTVTAKHPGTRHSQFKSRAKKAAKYTAIGAGVGAGVGLAAYAAKDINRVKKQRKSKNYLDRTSRRMIKIHQVDAKLGRTYDRQFKGMPGHASARHVENAKAHKIAAKKYSASKTVRRVGAYQKRKHIKKHGRYLSRARYY